MVQCDQLFAACLGIMIKVLELSRAQPILNSPAQPIQFKTVGTLIYSMNIENEKSTMNKVWIARREQASRYKTAIKTDSAAATSGRRRKNEVRVGKS